MSSKTAFVRARVEPALKDHVDIVFKKLGITATQAVTMLYKYVERNKTIPFDLSTPNKETARVIREARAGKGLIESDSLEDFFKETGIR